MAADLISPFATDHPVAVALKAPSVRKRFSNAIHVLLARRAADLSPARREAEVEEIFQEAIWRAWQCRDKYEAGRDIVTWLSAFASNVAHESRKKRCRHAAIAAGLPADAPEVDDLAVAAVPPLDEVLANRQHLDHLLAQLSPAERTIVCLKHLREMTCAEIGHQIGKNENAVRIQLFRAMKKLRDLSDPAGNPTGEDRQ